MIAGAGELGPSMGQHAIPILEAVRSESRIGGTTYPDRMSCII